MPNSNGTLALTSDLGAYLPLSGGTLTGALGGTSATFSSTGSFLTNSGATTTEKQIIVANTGGSMRAGVESSAGGAIQLGTLAYAAVFGNQANAATQFTTNGTARLTITSGGDVGIGTTSPAVKFNVNSGGTSGNSFSAAFSDNTTNQNSIAFSHFDNNSRIYATFLAGAGSDQSLSFWTTLSNSAQFERMRITSGGNVLIGNPPSDNGAKLQVNGGVFINGVTSNVLISHGEKFIPLSGPNSVHSFDVATEFPSLAISGNVLGVTMFLTIFGSGGSVYSAIATIARNSGGTWSAYGLTAITSTASLLSSITGSGTTITINTSAGSYVGVKVTAITQ
jgi:hypothetical protein